MLPGRGRSSGGVEALQHPAEDRVGEQVCKERGELELLCFHPPPHERKKMFWGVGSQKNFFPPRLWGPAPALLLLTSAGCPRVGVGAEADDGPLGGQVAGAAMGEGTLVHSEGSHLHPG